MSAPRPPSLEEIEEDLRAASHSDVVFQCLREGEGKTSGEGKEGEGVAELAMQFVQAQRRLEEEQTHSLPEILKGVQRHISELEAAVSNSSSQLLDT